MVTSDSPQPQAMTLGLLQPHGVNLEPGLWSVLVQDCHLRFIKNIIFFILKTFSEKSFHGKYLIFSIDAFSQSFFKVVLNSW